MPEGLEAEIYRSAAATLVGRKVTAISVDSLCGDEHQLRSVINGRIEDVARHGKFVDIVTTRGVIGMHFGMTGRLIVDELAAIDRLEYGSARDDRRWDRIILQCGNSVIRVNDPRRWSRYSLDPDHSSLGIDLLSSKRALATALRSASHRTSAVKGVLLDQHLIAGLGNLLADEVLFDAAIDPARSFDSLSEQNHLTLTESIFRVVRTLGRRGGSHTGRVGPAIRRVGALCPIDGVELQRRTIAGRTTFSCPVHQS